MYTYQLSNLKYAKEVKKEYIKIEKATELICEDKGLSFIDCGKSSLLLGQTNEKSALIKVCTNLGVSNSRLDTLEDELGKLRKLNELPYKPDIIFDHTRKDVLGKPFWRHMLEIFNGIVATSPVLACFDRKNGIDKNLFLETIEEMASCGVRMMIFHPTITQELWEEAFDIRNERPTTSWSGTLLKRDIEINRRNESIVLENFDEILKILYKFNVTCDIGIVFRPARISEALDGVHKKELLLQEQFIKKAKSIGVFTIREGVGHIPLEKVEEFCHIIGNNTPIMPLPVSTDAAIEFDHVACAIASTLIGYFANLGVINPVTRVEHIGGVPKLYEILEALKTARTVAHSLDLRNVPAVKAIDDFVSDFRQEHHTCTSLGGLFGFSQSSIINAGCSRCGSQCPLLYNE